MEAAGEFILPAWSHRQGRRGQHGNNKTNTFIIYFKRGIFPARVQITKVGSSKIVHYKSVSTA